jgi:RNA polymerase sigma factor (sigma-70 family)
LLKLAFKKELLLEDDRLIEGCIAEERFAQNQLYSRFAPVMLGVCFRYAQSVQEAEDIMQDGFVKIFNNLKSFRRESSLKTWMCRIMANTAINYLKANKKFTFETDVEKATDTMKVSTLQFHKIDADILMKQIQDLPTGYRLVLNMFAIEGYSHKEIAEQLEITESTSRSQFTRAKQLLEKKIEKLNIGDPFYARR